MTTANRINDHIVLTTDRPCGTCGLPDCPDCGTYQLLPPAFPRQTATDLEYEYDRGRAEGYQDGYREGHANGYQKAYREARAFYHGD